ncbi:Linoleate 13S-lipoxygenase 2-1 [Hibiscus syriacus]|uniref:Lipoxygenase n=1 Tax=Hibiscus syriacus TaxID=106335 RepID=A0A6A3B6E0_HIBSY|nr:linoleate 13S-lipoxygenase 2-1, chloroplastic-like isoform X2 [Hibiscus syriacus]KAE8710609.1 Linoleate 13S-lipoxygenase 2-1 [Hibiscus syriacus]
MLKPQACPFNSIKTILPLKNPFLHGSAALPFNPRRPSFNRARNNGKLVFFTRNIKAINTGTEKAVGVKATVTVKQTVRSMANLGLSRGLDDIQDLLGRTLLLELVSAELDPITGREKKTIKGYAGQVSKESDDVKYEAKFEVPAGFGEVGAVIVENEHHREVYLQEIVLDDFHNAPVNVKCASWVHSKFDNPQKRVFFTNKSYLPWETPSGLKKLREEELKVLRGDGQGERKLFDRVYDYDVYNDLGDPDNDLSKKRPVLGGEQFPYPRRCRTGRPMCDTDPFSEKRTSVLPYVPRDEVFSDVKLLTFSTNYLYCLLHGIIPSLEGAIDDANRGFSSLTDIELLFNEGINLPPQENKGFLKSVMPRLIKTITDADDVLRFEPPPTVHKDKLFWYRDEEFARQTLAGCNPFGIQLVAEWPLRSKLDPQMYGPSESAITEELIEKQIKGYMTIDEAIKQKKLFLLDYHDWFLPYVKKVRDVEGTTLYGSRTVFFLNPDDTLRPLAIELTRPPMDGKPVWKSVYTPSWNSTDVWLWRLAKAHVLAHDSYHHQLVSHWLRTHCCTEPYILAANRQLSEMHPVYRLLHPHFRYTMETNSLGRQFLINADGIIESSFTPRKYALELNSLAYGQQWRFDHQGLPADLINRGIAVEDPSAPHGLRLAIKDYPFANDGLILWDAIKQWISEYVNHYYPKSSFIESDEELQAWWKEIRTVGHFDKKDELGWPDLRTPQDLIEILTTMVWVCSGHHASVNFGQYAYAGYFPNRPTIARRKMPNEDPSEEEWRFFLENPEAVLLECFPSQIQAAKVMAVWDVLSSHSPDEEYIGATIEPSWAESPAIKAAFERFNGKLKELERIVDQRNDDRNLKNRFGAGIVPYEFLKPFSEPGVTGKGVPNSISI